MIIIDGIVLKTDIAHSHWHITRAALRCGSLIDVTLQFSADDELKEVVRVRVRFEIE